MIVEKVEAYINLIAFIEYKDIVDFVSRGQRRTYRKNESFLREGDICDELLFVEKGAFRYFVTNDGEDFTKDFCLEGSNPFCTGFSSFVTQTPSLINIEALEISSVLVWKHAFVKELLSTMPWIAFARAIAEYLFVRKEKREIALLRDSAKERYQAFTRDFSDVMQRVPQYHIASYLGITPESLSRIRRSLARKTKS